MVEFVHMNFTKGRPSVKQDDQRKIRQLVMREFRSRQREKYSQTVRERNSMASKKSHISLDNQKSAAIGSLEPKDDHCASTSHLQSPLASSAGNIAVFLQNDVDLTTLGYWFWTPQSDQPARECIGECVPDQGLQKSWKNAEIGNQFALDTITAHAFLRKSELTGSKLELGWYQARGNMLQRINEAISLDGCNVSPFIFLTMGVLAWLELRAGQRSLALAHLRAIRALTTMRSDSRSPPGLVLIDRPEWMAVTLALNRVPQAFRDEPIAPELLGGRSPILKETVQAHFSSDQAAHVTHKALRNAAATPALLADDISIISLQRLFESIHVLELFMNGESKHAAKSDAAKAIYNITIIHDKELALLQNSITRNMAKEARWAFELVVLAIELSTWIARRPQTSFILLKRIEEILEQNSSAKVNACECFISSWKQKRGTLISLVWAMTRIVSFYLRIRSSKPGTLSSATVILKGVFRALNISNHLDLECILQDWPSLQGENFACLQDVLRHIHLAST